MGLLGGVRPRTFLCMSFGVHMYAFSLGSLLHLITHLKNFLVRETLDLVVLEVLVLNGGKWFQ